MQSARHASQSVIVKRHVDFIAQENQQRGVEMSKFQGALPHRFDKDRTNLQLLPKFGGIEFPVDAVYLDYASATPVEESVADEMRLWHTLAYGNPANRLHAYGEYAEHALMDARTRIAACLGAIPDNVCFTGSATEANNLILRGLALHPKRKRNRFVYNPAEHSSVTATLSALVDLPLADPIEICPLRLNSDGDLDIEHAIKVIDDRTLCVSVMDVNNETGVKCRDLGEIIRVAHQNGALVHCDAVQGFARAGFHLRDYPVDFAVISAGKIYGPKGVAAMCRSERAVKVRLESQLTGGGQESGMRSGTVNLAAIRGFARAAELAAGCLERQTLHLMRLEELFLSTLERESPKAFKRYGHAVKVPGIIMLSFEDTNAMKLLESVPNLCVSAGSACRTLQATASHVLLAMGVPLEEALGSLRISLGIPTTEQDVQTAAHLLSRALASAQ